MSFFRLVAKFEPGHPRLTGSCSANTRRGQQETICRGAWRVVESYEIKWLIECLPRVYVCEGELFSMAPRELRAGTLCNPHKLLNAALAAQRRQRGPACQK